MRWGLIILLAIVAIISLSYNISGNTKRKKLEEKVGRQKTGIIGRTFQSNHTVSRDIRNLETMAKQQDEIEQLKQQLEKINQNSSKE